MDYVLSRKLLRTPPSAHMDLVFDNPPPNRFKGQKLRVCARLNIIRQYSLDKKYGKKNGTSIKIVSLNQYNNKKPNNPGLAAALEIKHPKVKDKYGRRGITIVKEAIRFMSQTESQIYWDFVDRQSLVTDRSFVTDKMKDFSETAVAKRAMEWICARPFLTMKCHPLRNLGFNLEENETADKIIEALKEEVNKRAGQEHSSSPESSRLARNSQAFIASLTSARKKTLEKKLTEIDTLQKLAEEAQKREQKGLQLSTPESSRSVEQTQKAQSSRSAEKTRDSISGASPRKKKTLEEKLEALKELEKLAEEKEHKELQSSTPKSHLSAKQTQNGGSSTPNSSRPKENVQKADSSPTPRSHQPANQTQKAELSTRKSPRLAENSQKEHSSTPKVSSAGLSIFPLPKDPLIKLTTFDKDSVLSPGSYAEIWEQGYRAEVERQERQKREEEMPSMVLSTGREKKYKERESTTNGQGEKIHKQTSHSFYSHSSPGKAKWIHRQNKESQNSAQASQDIAIGTSTPRAHRHKHDQTIRMSSHKEPHIQTQAQGKTSQPLANTTNTHRFHTTTQRFNSQAVAPQIEEVISKYTQRRGQTTHMTHSNREQVPRGNSHHSHRVSEREQAARARVEAEHMRWEAAQGPRRVYRGENLAEVVRDEGLGEVAQAMIGGFGWREGVWV